MLMIPSRKWAWIACFWPGLPQLWNRGSWVGLAVAVGFTALANVLLMASCVFTEWIPPQQLGGGAALLAVVWTLAWWVSRAEFRRSGNQELLADFLHEEPPNTETFALHREESEQLIRDAQREYLAGDWVATEQLLLRLLKEDARDVEGRLMLATLWRRQGRLDEALRQLDKLARLEAAEKWQNEIEFERKQIAALKTKQFDDQPANNDTTREPDKQPSAEVASDLQQISHETNRRLAA